MNTVRNKRTNYRHVSTVKTNKAASESATANRYITLTKHAQSGTIYIKKKVSITRIDVYMQTLYEKVTSETTFVFRDRLLTLQMSPSCQRDELRDIDR